MNDIIRRIYYLKSNKYDVYKDGLLAVKRIDLQDHERKPRPYTRKNERYWNEEIKEQRRKRKWFNTTIVSRQIILCSNFC